MQLADWQAPEEEAEIRDAPVLEESTTEEHDEGDLPRRGEWSWRVLGLGVVTKAATAAVEHGGRLP